MKEARHKREESRHQGNAYIPHSMTFRDVAIEWLKRKVVPSQGHSHVARRIWRLEHLARPAQAVGLHGVDQSIEPLARGVGQYRAQVCAAPAPEVC